MTFDFKDRVAVVTGGGRGIGASVASILALAGARVAVFDILEEEAERTCAAIVAQGGSAKAFRTDITNMRAVKERRDELLALWGRIDILVCSAGIVLSKPFAECDEADWDRVMNVNAKGVFTCCQAILPGMMERRYGKIVNVSSVAAKTGGGFFGNLIYGASKAAVISYSKGLAREAGPFGVNVNVVCPSATDTPMIVGLTGDDRHRIVDSILLKRVAEPGEIANAIVFLVSDHASFITSEVLNVDGGIMKGN